MVKVLAKRTGYYGHKRRREGAEFAMNEKDFIKKEKVLNQDGKEFIKIEGDEFLVPTWVELVDVEEKPRPKAKPKSQEPKETDDVI